MAFTWTKIPTTQYNYVFAVDVNELVTNINTARDNLCASHYQTYYGPYYPGNLTTHYSGDYATKYFTYNSTVHATNLSSDFSTYNGTNYSSNLTTHYSGDYNTYYATKYDNNHASNLSANYTTNYSSHLTTHYTNYYNNNFACSAHYVGHYSAHDSNFTPL